MERPEIQLGLPVQYLNGAESGSLLESHSSPIYVPPDSRVLLVGPGVWEYQDESSPGRMPMDPNVVTLATHLSKGRGILTILDLGPGGGVYGGVRNWKDVKARLGFWDLAGADLCSHGFVEGNILIPPKSLETYDAIIDHMTWKFLEHPDSLKLMAKNYASLLNEEGKAICYYGRARGDWFKMLVEAFSKEGLKCRDYRDLKDIYPVHNKVVLQDLRSSNYGTDIFNDPHLIPWHKAVGVVVAEK